MAPPTTAAGYLVGRSLSHGGIAGAVVGSVLGFLLIFILVLPFILRPIREHRYHKKIAAENAAMGMTGPGFHGGPPSQAFHPLFYEPPAGAAAGPGADGSSAPGPSDPSAKIGDNNSSEDGKTAVAGSLPTPPADGAPKAPADANTPTAVAPGVAAPPLAALPPGSVPIKTNIPPQNGPQSASLAGSQLPYPPPTLNSAATFPTFSSQDPVLAPPQRSATMRSTRSSSISQTLETIAGRAAAVFRQGSTRSSPSRSPTFGSSRGQTSFDRSPVELNFNRHDNVDHHTWLMRQQGIDDNSIGVDPGFFEVNTQYLTGASAEYYSGAPLSPPTDPNSHLMSPISYAAKPPSRIATSLASMASAAAVAGVASGSKKQSKPTVSRTDSIRTAGTGTENDISPLPLSPTSPLPTVSEGSRGIKQEAPSPAQTGERGISSPPAGPGAVKPKELTPELGNFSQHSPSYRPLVPSPQLPAPGTVNPRDVWAPATDDERFIHKTAELDRFEQSPPPALPNNQADPAVFVSGGLSGDPGAYNGAGQEEASETVEASPQPLSPAEASPDVSFPDDAHSVKAESTPAGVPIPTPTHFADPVNSDVAHDIKTSPQSLDDAPSNDVLDSNIGSGQLDPEDFDELMQGLDDQSGYNFAFGDNQQPGFVPDIGNDSNNINNDLDLDLKNDFGNSVNVNNANNNPDLNLKNDFDNTFDNTVTTGYNSASTIPSNLDNGFNSINDINGINGGINLNANNGINPNIDGMGAYSLGGVAVQSGVYQSMPQQGPMYWNMPNNVPTIAGPFMTPVTQPDYSNGMALGPPFTVPSNMPDGMNNMNGANGMHVVDYGKDNNAPQFALQTPQSSPGQLPINTVNGTLPPGMLVPLTPSPQRLAPNFNSPLSVPGSSIPSRPVSPASNQGSTPGQSSSTSPRTFACEDCGRVFDQVHKLNHHKRYHERPHECTVPGCGKRFGTRTHLDRHVNDKHSKSRKYHCTEEGCPYSVPGGKSFPRKDNWRRHMVNKHGVHPEHEPIEVIDQPMAYA
ncbi:hypothetical protein SEUCBS139899_007046 [Sporothrix eucalyptigena]